MGANSSTMTVDGVNCGPDGMRADVFGNLWCSSSAPLGYAGVLVYNAQGKMIGRIRLAGGLREPVLWRPEAQPVVHDGEPVGLHAAGEHAGRRTGIVEPG